VAGSGWMFFQLTLYAFIRNWKEIQTVFNICRLPVFAPGWRQNIWFYI